MAHGKQSTETFRRKSQGIVVLPPGGEAGHAAAVYIILELLVNLA